MRARVRLLCSPRCRWNRNWRFHKKLRLWVTKELHATPSQKIPGGEMGMYTYWDPEVWQKERKQMTVEYKDLEDKSAPVFAPLPTIQVAAQAPGSQRFPPGVAVPTSM